MHDLQKNVHQATKNIQFNVQNTILFAGKKVGR